MLSPVVCALLLGACLGGSGGQAPLAPKEEKVTVTLTGETVSLRYLHGEEPRVSEGRFTVENRAADAVTLQVARLAVIEGEHQQTIPSYHLYVLPDYAPVVPPTLTVQPGEQVAFALSFEAVPLQARFGVQPLVRLQGHLGDVAVEADSPVEAIRVDPR